MILFAVTINFAAFDWIMTLDPHWFSACLGIYYFAGCVVATLAAMTLIVFTLQRFNYLQDITLEHYHDLGKLLFGFTMFWAYIAFSQYLLIWYANIPEETLWYAHRQTGGWQYVGLLLIVGHFLIPLFGMMSRHVKRNPSALAAWAAFLLLMRLVDVFWLVKPVYASTISVTAADVLCLIGVAAIATRSVLKRMAAVDLVPTADPHLEESVAFHQAF